MKLGPDIAGVAALIGDPARANMLSALMHGAALTASELALEAGVTKQTASSHLGRLSGGGLVAIERQGRHRYYRLADADVAHALESLMGVAARARPRRTRTGPREPALRHARVCYDHLAGDLGVHVLDALLAQGWLARKQDEETQDGKTQDALAPTTRGVRRLRALGIDVTSLRGSRPLCRTCLDWSARRSHLAGALGAALLRRCYELGWARQRRDSRVVEFSARGEAELKRVFRLS